MERDDVLIAFKGSITSELLTSILQIMETKMEDLHEAPRTKKKVFNVLVECLQNLYHHIDDFEVQGSAEEVSEKKSAIFSISRTVESYNIVTGNFVSNENVINLTNKINKINDLTRDELKAYYKQVLNNGEISEKGGGGLGFIDIAKKSGEKLVYKLREIDESYSFFTLTVKISQI
jgi:hypothetical protein